MEDIHHTAEHIIEAFQRLTVYASYALITVALKNGCSEVHIRMQSLFTETLCTLFKGTELHDVT